MALWRIVVKNSGNAACKDKRQRLEKGMFIETSTVSPIPPIGVARERPMLAQSQMTLIFRLLFAFCGILLPSFVGHNARIAPSLTCKIIRT